MSAQPKPAPKSTIIGKLSALILFSVTLSLGAYSLFAITKFREDKLKYAYLVTSMQTESAGRSLAREFDHAFSMLNVAKELSTQAEGEGARHLGDSLRSILLSQPQVEAFMVFDSSSSSEPRFAAKKDSWNVANWKEKLRTNAGSSLQNATDGARTIAGLSDDLILATRQGSLNFCLVLRGREIRERLSALSLADVSVRSITTGDVLIGSEAKGAPAQVKQDGIENVLKLARSSRISQGSVDYKGGDGGDRVGAFYKINSDYVVITELKKEDVLLDISIIIRDLIAFGVIAASLALVAAALFSRKISRPLKSLMTMTDQLAAGRYDIKPAFSTSDELGELANHFSILGERLLARERELETTTELANHDSMTGLYNHRFFRTQFEKSFELARRHKRPLSLLLLDVDFFKKVNDTYGHPQGDHVLKILAALLKSSGRNTDFICRYGGEEFVLVLCETPLEGAHVVAEKIRSGFEKLDIEIIGSKEIMKKTLSVGIASLSDDGATTIDDLIKISDENLYRAKEGGRNRICSSQDKKTKAA